jgi:hypothetical protein
MRFCFCEDATALQRRDHIENKVIRSFAARHTFLFVFMEREEQSNDFAEPEYN